MKILFGDKDGGSESRVWAYGIEIKTLFSVLLLRFGKGSREAYHTHAFNSISWVLSGGLHETFEGRQDVAWHFPSFRPVRTLRSTFHRVAGLFDRTWVLTLRGPWYETWRERRPELVTLTHGRKVVA